MVKKIKIRLFILIFIGFFSDSFAQKYWVGGSGDWGDSLHWSYSSGGVGGAGVPSIEDDVIVDNQSFSKNGQINLKGKIFAKSIVSTIDKHVLVFNSNEDLILIVKEEFRLSSLTVNAINGFVYLLNIGTEFRSEKFKTKTFYGVAFNGSSQPKQRSSASTLAITDIDITVTDQTCPGDCDGSISSVITGDGPFSIEWFDGNGNIVGTDITTISGLCTGQYLITVQDDSDGSVDFVDNINVGPTYGLIIASTPVTCPGGNNGALNASIIGGNAPLNYSWSNGSTSEDIVGLIAGNYTLTVTDNNGCVISNNRTVNQPPPIVITPNPVQIPLCGGIGCTEDVTFTVAGGNGPAFVWSNGTTSINMCPGATFTSTVTDSRGCQMIGTHTASVPPTITATASVIQIVTCAGVSDASGSVSGSGGTAPYTYRWLTLPGIPTSQVVSNLGVGNYTVEVRDANGCTDTDVLSITAPIPPVVTALISSFNDVVCLGLPTGGATASGLGGTTPYLFNWFDLTGNPTTATVNNLDVGTYNVEVRDQIGCRDTATVVIAAPNPPVITTTLSGIVIPPCGVGCVGAATATANGGVAPYSYSWFNAPGFPSSQSVSNLCPGSYDVAVQDLNGCKDTVNLNISALPLVLSLDNQTNIICAGASTGAANVSTSGGTAPFIYSWYDVPGTPTTEDISNVPAGNYHLAVVDANGCRDTLIVTITQPNNPILINIDNQVNNLCSGDCNGALTVSFSGGNLPITRFEWTDVAGTPSILSLANLCNGTYTFEVEDNLGCIETLPINITSPVTSVSFVIEPLCFGDTHADVRAIPSGGTLPYQLRWYDVPGQPTTPIVTNLLPGTYHLEIIDGNGCTDTFTLSFSIPTELIASIASSTPATCQGICTGQITASVIGGTLPYTTSWYNMTGLPSALIQNNVCPGNYNLAVVDANGCRDTVNTTIAATFDILTTPSTTPATCQGICDASASIVASNGQAPYTYRWFDAPGIPTSDNIVNACVGTYNVAVRDALGCVDTIPVSITAPLVVTTSISSQTNNICASDCNGQASISGAGGTQPYAYSWTNVTGNPTINSVSNLCNGSYIGRITDVNGCFDEETINITSNITTVSFTITQPSCGGYSDGQATAIASGGQAPYQLRWIGLPGVPTSNNVVGLSAGTYELEVRDANNCIDTFDLVVTDPFPAIVGVTSSQSISCFGMCDGKAWVTTSGGFAPYTYDWWTDPNTSVTDTSYNLCFGTYFVAITDAIGCNDTAAVVIGNPFSISVDLDTKPCFGFCDGSITSTVNGGLAPFDYLWNDPALSTTSSIGNLCPGTYKVIVTNATGCVDSAQTIVDQNTEITSIITSTQTTCTNTTNGSAEVVVSGGTANYAFQWSNANNYSSSVSNPNDLGIGKYYVVISDSYNCTKQDSITIDEVFFVDAFAGNDQIICEGDTIKLGASGGVDYSWSTGETTDSITVQPTFTTTYTLTALNSVCSDEDDVTISVNPKPVAFITADKTSILEGTSTSLYGNGGGSNGVYDWQPPSGISDPTAQNPIVNPLIPTTYFLTVTDENGCVDTTSIYINVFESIVFPDGFSPNGDGINDDWEIRNIENFPAAIVEVYNRWGQQIFYSVGYAQRWDGTHKNKALPVGTYYFIIDLGSENGTALPKYTGPITILR